MLYIGYVCILCLYTFPTMVTLLGVLAILLPESQICRILKALLTPEYFEYLLFYQVVWYIKLKLIYVQAI